MALVLNCWETANSAGTAVTELAVNKPTSGSAAGDSPKNAAAGDLLIILCGNDDNTSTAQWDDADLKPTGFTLINEAGGDAQDCHCAAFYKIVVGDEDASFTIPSQSSDEMWAVCILVSGYSPTLHVAGADATDSTPAPFSITELTTTTPNTLCFFVAALDGGDAGAFATAGTGWVERAEIYAGTAADDACGVWGTKVLAAAGASGAAEVTPTTADGMYGFQFAIKEVPTVVPKKAGLKARAPIIDFLTAPTEGVWQASDDDEWANTDDDTWYGVEEGNEEVTVKKAIIRGVASITKQRLSLVSFVKSSVGRLLSRRLPRPQAIFANAIKSARLRFVSKKAGFLSVFSLSVKKTATRIQAGKSALQARIIMSVKAARARLVSRKAKITETIALFIKYARSKARATISTTTSGVTAIAVTIKHVGLKLRAAKARFILVLYARAKKAIFKLRAVKLPAPWAIFQIRAKAATVKTRTRKSSILLAIPVLLKTARLRVRSLRSRILSVIIAIIKDATTKTRAGAARIYTLFDQWKSTADDYWASLRDDEWFGIIWLSVKKARTRMTGKKLTLVRYTEPLVRSARIRIRPTKATLRSVFETIALVIRNARLRLRAQIPTVITSFAIIALAVKDAYRKVRSMKSALAFSMGYLFVKAARIRQITERFTGWSLSFPIASARMKMGSRKVTGLFDVIAKSVRVFARVVKPLPSIVFYTAPKSVAARLGATVGLISRGYTLAAKSAGTKIRATISTTTGVAIGVYTVTAKRVRMRIKTRKDRVWLSYHVRVKAARIRMRSLKAVVTFSYAIIAAYVKTARLRLRPVRVLSTFSFAVYALIVRTSAIRANVHIIAPVFRNMTAAVKTARLALKTLLVSMTGANVLIRSAGLKTVAGTAWAWNVTWLSVKSAKRNAMTKITGIYAAIPVVARSVRLKTRTMISWLQVNLGWTVSTKTARFKSLAPLPSISLAVWTGTKIARFTIVATKSIYTTLWLGIATFWTRAISYILGTGTEASIFTTRAEAYYYVTRDN